MGDDRVDWLKVKEEAEKLIQQFRDYAPAQLDGSQIRAIERAVSMLVNHGVILADEVGLGKTRVALVIGEAVMRAGGSVASIVPPGLLYQWERETAIFANIPETKIIKHIVHLRSFENIFNEKNFPILKNHEPSWVLASHNFGFLFRKTDNNDRYDLFSLIKINLLGRKTAEWAEIEKDILKRQKKFTSFITTAAVFLSKIQSISNNDIWKKYKKPIEGNSLKKDIFDSIEGQNLAYKCIGKLLGSVDFLIIDEAHKNKEISDDDEEKISTRLTKLTQKIIIQPSDCRRLCMTATPIELHSSQWKNLFSRCKLPEIDKNEDFVENFEKALDAAQKNPKNPDVLEDLITSSEKFKEEMSKFVIRRKRINNEAYKNRIKKLGLNLYTVDPHVNIRELSINPEMLSESKPVQKNWKKAVFCFEGMSLASQGILTNQKSKCTSKMQRYHYASGLMNFEDIQEELDNLKDCPKKERLKFWNNQVNNLLQQDNFALYSHPRILETAKKIREEIKIHPGEKILVFGTYSKPIEVLRNMLNALYIIDCARFDPEKPTNRMGLRYEQIYAVYQQFHGMWSFDEMKRRVENCERANENFLKRLNMRFNNTAICEKLNLKNVKQEEQDEICKRIRLDLADALREKDLRNRDDKSRRQEEEIFNHICEAYCEGIIDQFETEEKQNNENNDGGDVARIKKLFDALGLGKDKNEDMSRRHSAFCRLMDGKMKMSTRRVVQELFNREETFPKVLITQSLVGREGLNLQKACRNVFIFHPEWNPAVIEQEIGRVDRMDSLWEKLVDKWQEGDSELPKIQVTFVVFKGTYDEHQYKVYKKRRERLDAQLSGVLLENKADEIPEEYKKRLAKVAPNFEP